ncbi:uncharacterized protein TNCV_2584721 [Trichonephila clavipes]|nr:uncharacterized protein TNCV_2584721 [Trichonephila clavipes]
MKDRILKLAENVTDQQKNDINSAPFISLCLDESIDITKSARLAVFARYCVGNIIKEELIVITSSLKTLQRVQIFVRQWFAIPGIERLWHGGTLNSQRAISPLGRLVEREERWETLTTPRAFYLKIGAEPSQKTYCHLYGAQSNEK